MATILSADIFFFITSVAVIICGIILAVALWNLAGILRNVRRATDVLGDTFSFLKKKRKK
jgi:hypothetical protein